MTSTTDDLNTSSNNGNTDQIAEQEPFETENHEESNSNDGEPTLERSVEQFSSFDELLEKVQQAKENGNEMYKQKKYKESIPFYEQAIAVWFDLLEEKFDVSPTKEQVQQLKVLIRDTYNNAALAVLEMGGSPDDALKCAASAYRINENLKSIYIQAKCFYLYKHFTRAKIYLNLVLKEQPDNKDAQKLLADCELMEKEYSYEPSFHYDPLKQREDEELQKAIALSKLQFEEEEKKRAEELSATQQADKEQDEIRRNFEIEQQKRQLEKLKEEETHEHQDEDYEIEVDDDDVEVHHDDDEEEGELDDEELADDISLTESEIEEQMRLLELEEKKANFIETDDVD